MTSLGKSASSKSASSGFKPSVRFLVVALSLLAAQAAHPTRAVAQNSDPQTRQTSTDTSAASFYGNEFEASVQGKPFSAVEERVTTFRTADSKLENRSLTITQIYRDSQGRLRADRRTTTYDGSGVATQRSSSYIADPASHTILILDPERRTAVEVPWDAPNPAELQPVRAASAGEQFGQIHVKTEPLGDRSMQGLTVDGSMREMMIPVKAYSFYRPVTVSIETWISRELGVPVFSRSETSTGEISTTTLKDVVRSEPNLHLFELPSNFTLTSPGTDSVFAMSR